MANLSGDRIVQIEWQTLAAATTDDYYLCPGYQQGSGTTDNAGVYRDIEIHEIAVGGSHDTVVLMGIRVNHVDGKYEYLLQQSATANMGLRSAALTTAGRPFMKFRMETLARNVRNIQLIIRNVDGSNSRQLEAYMIFTPVK